MVYWTSVEVKTVKDVNEIPSAILHKILGKYPVRSWLLWFPPGNIYPREESRFPGPEVINEKTLLSNLHLGAYITNRRMGTD
jgi:hypothetical protein